MDSRREETFSFRLLSAYLTCTSSLPASRHVDRLPTFGRSVSCVNAHVCACESVCHRASLMTLYTAAGG